MSTISKRSLVCIAASLGALLLIFTSLTQPASASDEFVSDQCDLTTVGRASGAIKACDGQFVVWHGGPSFVTYTVEIDGVTLVADPTMPKAGGYRGTLFSLCSIGAIDKAHAAIILTHDSNPSIAVTADWDSLDIPNCATASQSLNLCGSDTPEGTKCIVERHTGVTQSTTETMFSDVIHHGSVTLLRRKGWDYVIEFECLAAAGELCESPDSLLSQDDLMEKFDLTHLPLETQDAIYRQVQRDRGYNVLQLKCPSANLMADTLNVPGGTVHSISAVGRGWGSNRPDRITCTARASAPFTLRTTTIDPSYQPVAE